MFHVPYKRLFMIKYSLQNNLFLLILVTVNINVLAAVNVTESPNGILVTAPDYYNQPPSLVHDGLTTNYWTSRWVMKNIFEFTFDNNNNGITSENGDLDDLFTLESISLFSPGDTTSVNEFIIESQNNHGSWQRIFSPQPVANPYNFAEQVTGGHLTVQPTHYNFDSPAKIMDGSTLTHWTATNGVLQNTFEFEFDPNLNGTSGEAADQFTLDSIALFSPGNTNSMKEFIIESQNNHGSWQRIFSPQPVANPYNFAKQVAGGHLTVQPTHYNFDSPAKIMDGSTLTRWTATGGVLQNTFEFEFDPNLNGTSGEAADQFTLDSIALFSPGDTASIKDFEITIETTSGWQPVILLTATQTTTEQVFPIGPYSNVLKVKLKTLTSYGANHVSIQEFEVRGVWSGLNPVFKANAISGEQAFDLTANPANNDGRRQNITKLKLQTVSSYGHSQMAIKEFEVRGVWSGLNPVFKANAISGEQVFDLTANPANNDGRRQNITKLKLQTVSSYGHSQMTIKEFEVRGVWNGLNPVFKANAISGEQVFDLTANPANNDGRRNDITRLKLQTVNNYGHSEQRINEFQAFGIINKKVTGGFNAFDSTTAPSAITGSLQTRIASNGSISFDVIALNTDKTAVDTNFTNDVKVELLANMTSVASDSNNCPVSSTIISTLSATTIANGRSTVNMPAVNNVWKDVAVRISYQPPTGVLITTCAIDRFSIRPAAFTLVSQHNDWQTAGNNETLNSATFNASPIHKAGRMFSLQIKAVDSAGTVMSNYADIPVIATNYPTLLSPTTGVLGTFSSGSLTNVNGVIDSHTARYSEVGAFTLKMIDEDFSSIDASDGTSLNARTISSPELTIGRFVPDHFKVSTVSNGSFDNACTGFSYNGQSFGYQTVPEIKVTAYNAQDAITQNYTGNFAKLTVNDFTITAANHDAVTLAKDDVNLIRVNRSAAPVTLNDNTDGSLNFAFGNDLYTHLHDSNSQVSPFSNAINLQFTDITDSDGITTQSLPHLLQVTGGTIRFGRLVINNAHGTELLPLPVTIKTEYFNGIDWTENTADHCTTFNLNSHFRLANPETSGGGWLAGSTTMTIANSTSTATLQQIASGQGLLTFSAPGEDNDGFITIKSNLTGSFDWLLGDYNNDGLYREEASARASFGVFKGSDTIIFKRELY